MVTILDIREAKGLKGKAPGGATKITPMSLDEIGEDISKRKASLTKFD